MSRTVRCRHCLQPIVWKKFAHRPRWIHVFNRMEYCGMNAADPRKEDLR